MEYVPVEISPKYTPRLENNHAIIDALKTSGMNIPTKDEKWENDLIALANTILAEINPQHQTINNITNGTFEMFSDLYTYTYQLLRYRELMGWAQFEAPYGWPTGRDRIRLLVDRAFFDYAFPWDVA